MNFNERSKHAHNSVAQKLFTLMHEKQTNLAVAADVTTKKELLNLAQSVGSEICLLKTHIDIIEDFDWDLIIQLQELAQKYNFLIVEDRKFCDIGSTVKTQYAGGMYKIAQWADIVICHAISGPAMIDAFRQAAPDKNRALLLLAHMSSKGNLIDEQYSKAVVKIAKENNDFVIGCICQEQCLDDPGMLALIPGINLAMQSDTLGQQYNTPEKAIIERSADIIIVGRGIYQAEDQKAAAQRYRQAAWNAFQSRMLTYNDGWTEPCMRG